MKNFIFYFLLVTSFLSCSQKKSIVGQWESHSAFSDDKITFETNGSLTYLEKGKHDISDLSVSGLEKYNSKYEINESVKPHNIDFVFYSKDNKEAFRQMGIYEYIDNSTIRMFFNHSTDMNKNATRPTGFNDEAFVQILTRK